MERDIGIKHELEFALAEAWCRLHEVHMMLEGTGTTVPFETEPCFEALAELQAEEQVLGQLEKEGVER